MANLHKSAFLKANEKGNGNANIKSDDSTVKFDLETQTRTVDFSSFEVHLDNEMVVSIDLTKKTKYKLKNGYLYYGLFKKLGKIKFMRIKF